MSDFSVNSCRHDIIYNKITEITFTMTSTGFYKLKMNNCCIFLLGLYYVYEEYTNNFKVIPQVLFHFTNITLITNVARNICLISLTIDIIID